MLIADRERLAPPLRLIIPPTFEVHRPHLVRRLTTSATMQPTSLRRRPSPGPPLSQARSLQHPLETALARGLAIKAQIQFPDLARPPAGMRLLQAHHLTHFPLPQSSRTAVRPTRFFPQPLCPPTH